MKNNSYFKTAILNVLYLSVMGQLALCGCIKRQAYAPPAPQLITINIIDRNGVTETISNPDRLANYDKVDFLKNQPYQKVMRIYSRDVNGDVYAYLTSYHENGQPSQYLEIVNNRAFGCYKEWHSNGKISVEAHVIGGISDLTTAAEKSWLFDGLSSAWDEDGNLEAQIHYAKGILEGPSLYYHKNGSLWKSMQYENGNLEGVLEIFKENGEVFQTSMHDDGKKHGISQRFWSEGQIAFEENYEKGRLLNGIYYDCFGKLVSEVRNGCGTRAVFGKESVNEFRQITNGLEEGRVEQFSPEGNIICRYKIKNGLKHGEEIFYYEGGKIGQEAGPKLSINWQKGLIHGTVKTWYPDGQQESQREMTNNAKNGILTAWYQNGSLMLIEEYSKDVLTKGEYYKKGEKLPVSEVFDGEGLASLYDPEGGFLRKINYKNGKPFELSGSL